MATNPKKYREQVISVEALQYDGTNAAQMNTWTGGNIVNTPEGGIALKIPNATLPVTVTDWVITDPWKNWFVMSDLNFQITYAPGPN